MNTDFREMKRRRKELMAHMEPDSIALIASEPPKNRNNDAEYQYRQDSDFYYLTGFTEQQAVLALIPGRKQGEVVLFCQEKDKLKELWTGILTGPDLAREKLLVDDAFPVSDINDIVPGLIEGRERVYYSMGKDPHFDQQVMDWVKVVRSHTRQGIHPPGEFLVLDHLLHEQRLIKSSREVKLMEKAAKISSAAHKRAMTTCKPGVREYQLEAELLHEFYRNGSRHPAYNSIVASGDNACILHYDTNDAEIKDGDLVLIDAGCEYAYYASDITRTFPANGKFSPQQRAIYDIVLKANLAAIDAVRVGVAWDEPHKISVKIITAGLIKLGLIKETLGQAIKKETYRDFYMHKVGHWLGIDVHDVGDYQIDGKWRLLEPGMVTTIEPGIYIAPDNRKVASKWRGIGVRIEDDVLVTRGDPKVLSRDVPKHAVEIEALMAGSAR